MKLPFVCCLLLVGGICLQGYSQATIEKIPPKYTEVWEPEPAIVTPGEGTAPPSDAIVLFDGTDLSEWTNAKGKTPGWKLEGDMVITKPGTGYMISKRSFGDVQLHIEWKAPTKIEGEGQGRGNSGVFLMGKYEVQVLDSYDNRTYSNGQAASVYKQHIPLVNAMRPPGEWQMYDIIFKAPTFNEDGTLRAPATFTVLHNGILVQNHVTLLGPTVYDSLPRYKKHEPKLPLALQDHSNPVSFRNIWIREL
ncbi:MAG: DUF1080 domain-containing protein [Bacteroidota bacterium]